jgi:hypothetical protein
MKAADPNRALQDEIKAREASDPLIGPKIAAHAIYARVFDALRGERGVHVESLLAVLASLAGYACQVAVRRKAVADGMHEAARLVRVDGSDGRVYWFGDALNVPLLESELSVWSLAAGGAQAAGLSALPALDPIITHVANSVGGSAFGVPRGTAASRLPAPPEQMVRLFWSGVRPILADTCRDPMHWPVALGIALQRAIEQGAAALDPAEALVLVMECALPTSKLDLGPLDAFALAERSAAS